jgi:hypothetical protein
VERGKGKVIAPANQVGNNGGVNARILMVAAGNAVVALATYAYLGFNTAGGAAAARNTARFSSVVFAIALATHFHRRLGSSYRAWIYSFVAAHVVHFGTVVAFHALTGKLANPMFLGVAAGGSLLLAATALTTSRSPRFHVALTYVIWLSFVIALSSRLSKHLLPKAPLMAILVVAIVLHLRHLGAMRKQSTLSASA